MSKETRVENGDIVRVNMNQAQITLLSRARVCYTPCSDADYWHFEDLNTGEVVNTNERITITLLEKIE